MVPAPLSRLFKPIVTFLEKSNPQLRKKLRMAHIDKKVETYLEERIQGAFVMSVGLTVFCFFIFSRFGVNMLLLPLILVGTFLFFSLLFVRSIDANIHRRAKQIDREVLFAGRFLLVKLNAGQPLVNALVDASHSYGVANKFFKEIVRDIDLGTPVEEALENASRYTPSKKFRAILFQITNAIKIGVDVSRFLEATLDDVANQQLIEIQRYGKKLNGITMFYMLLAIVVPSLGLTLFILVATLVGIDVNITLFSLLAFFMLIIEFIFISIFKTIRPTVNI